MRIRTLVLPATLTLAAAAAAFQVTSKSRAPAEEAVRPPIPAARFPVVIGRPDGPPRVSTAEVDDLGRPITAACSTCHATLVPNPDHRRAEDLDEFHQGLTFAHGGLTCLSCHDPKNYDRLRLADGASLPYAEVMELCGQCHGRQLRDYRGGAHGGMSGFWDLSRGPRTRNNCVDCHDAHAPVFPRMMPTFKPRDRFLTREKDHWRDE